MSATPLIRVTGVDMGYRRGSEEIRIFEGLDLAIDNGDFIAVMGPSGSGKTTLLNLLGGLDHPQRGDVWIAGQAVAGRSTAAMAQWRAAHIGFIFQFYNLMATLSAAENIELPLLLTRLSRAERRVRVDAALALVGLADRAGHRPAQLSGGQQQRVAIARAIISDPSLLLADEPTGDLDRTSAEEILALLTMLNREMGKTIVMVTHDQAAARAARRTLLLDKGRFVERRDLAA